MNILIDFDGTVVYEVPEGVCQVDTGAEKVLKKLVKAGHNLILWTCRNKDPQNPYNYLTGGIPKNPDSLDEAILWFKERGIPLKAVNEVPGTERFIGKSVKPLSHCVIDNTNLGIPKRRDIVDCRYYNGSTGKVLAGCVDWVKVEELLIKEGLL